VSGHWRWLVGLLMAGFLVGGGAVMLRSGLYGLTLFILMPVILGGLGAWCVRAKAADIAIVSGGSAVLLASLGWLALGQEGALCIAMSLPLSLPLGCLGGYLVYHFQAGPLQTGSAAMLLLLPAGTLGWDVNAKPPVFEVRSSIEIAASPEQVWKHVVNFFGIAGTAGVVFSDRSRLSEAGAH
jgi:hypothetical protein